MQDVSLHIAATPVSSPRAERAANDVEARNPVLDGIRGIAILLVLWIHLMPAIALPVRALEWLKKTSTAGWIGVDLFFVLSGFLITGILLDSKGGLHWVRNFYARRTLRIFPLYYVTLALVFLASPHVLPLPEEEAARMSHASPWFWTYLTNVGWFVQALPRHPWPGEWFDLRHFWSLAVEEHFYLIWPFVVFHATHRRLKVICLVLFGVSVALRTFVAMRWGGDSVAFHLTPCRFDALTAGAFLAVSLRDGTWRTFLPRAPWLALGLALPLASWFFFRKGLWDGDPFVRTAGLAMVAVLCATLLMLALDLQPGTLAHRALASPVLCFFGKYSYGLYVIHGTVGSLLERLLPASWWQAKLASPFAAMPAIILYKGSIAVVLSILSWHLLEKHCLKLKSLFPRAT